MRCARLVSPPPLTTVMLTMALFIVAHAPSAASVSSRLLIDPAGEHDGDTFGCSVASAGDVNADGYDDLAIGANYYPSGTRSLRLNLHLIRVLRSPASSNFGFYTSGQSGTTLSMGVDILM